MEDRHACCDHALLKPAVTSTGSDAVGAILPKIEICERFFPSIGLMKCVKMIKTFSLCHSYHTPSFKTKTLHLVSNV